MTAQVRFRESAMLWALGLGVLADVLIRAEGRPGLNFALWAVAGAGVLWLLSRREGVQASSESRWLVGAAVGFAWLLVLRDAEALAVFSLFGAIVLLGLGAGRAAHAWARSAGVIDVAVAAARVIALILLGPLGWLLGPAPQPELVTPDERRWPRHVRTLARGTVMAVPPLLVLGALLASADPVFAGILENLLFADLELVLEHVGFAAVITWFTSGWLRAFFVRDAVVSDSLRVPRPSVAPSELSVAVSLLVLLFAAFMAVQVRYLFGGADVIAVTGGLSYAEYARRGFFELVFATLLVVPVLLLADWTAADDVPRGRRVLRTTSTVLVLLLGGVLASAAYRLRLYQDAYGLTEQRLYVSVFMVWLTAVLVLLAVTVLRGRRRGFVFAAIVAGLVAIGALHVLNPHALIARVNLERASAGAEVDANYLRSLSADAVPVLVAELDRLPPAERCRAAAMVHERWSGPRPGGWRTWNLGDWRARRLVRQLPAPAPCPEPAV